MIFYHISGLTKVHQTVGFPLIRWIHKDSIYVRFGGRRNTKTSSKCKITPVCLIMVSRSSRDNCPILHKPKLFSLL